MHDLEINGNGEAQAIYALPAWHRLGTVKGDNFGWADAEAEGLTITLPVRKVAVQDLVIGYETQPDEYAAVRGDGLVLATGLGEQWTPFHASEAYEFGSVIREQAEAAGINANLRSLGTLDRGRKYFMTFDLGDFKIGDYQINDYLSVNGSYDSSWKFQVLSSEIVEVCANTVAAAKAAGVKHYTFKHTSGIRNRVEEAKAALGNHVANRDAFQRLGEKLLTVPISTEVFKGFLNDLFPVDDEVSTRARNVNEDAREKVNQLYKASDFVSSSGNGWAVVQAVNTYENWGTPVRKTKGTDERTTRALRQVDALTTGHQKLTDRAIELALAA